MTDENDSGSWMIKGFFACLLALFPTAGVFILLLLVPWMIPEWVFPTIILSFLVFLAGGGILVAFKDTRSFFYSIILGGMVGVCTIILATVRHLSLIPVPLFGNALNATAAGVGVLVPVFLFLWLRPTDSDVAQTGLITTSSKPLAEQKQTIQRLFMHNKPEVVLALELVEEPHDYIFSENDEESPSSHIERFSGIVRSLFSTPYSICYQQHDSKTRVYFTTWSNDETQLSHQRTVLLDTIQYSLPKFKFRILDSFTGIELGEPEKGSAAVITGVPLSVKDESQTKDPLENIVGVLRELENGIFQVFVEPVKMSKSKLKKL